MSISSLRTNICDRRTFLKGAGIALALPLLNSLPAAEPPAAKPVSRLVIHTHQFGMYAPGFHPVGHGRDWPMTDGLRPLAGVRDHITVFSHLHLGFTGGHDAAPAILCDRKRSEAAHAPDGGMSVDARAAEAVADHTRYPMLALWGDPDHDKHTSFTRSGTYVPPLRRPLDLFRTLFRQENAGERADLEQRLADEHSVLDAVRTSARQMEAQLSREDRPRLERYLTAVRDQERRLQRSQRWLSIERAAAPAGLEQRLIARSPDSQLQTYDDFCELIPLVLQTDVSRVVTLDVRTSPNWDLPGVSDNYHSLTHHGQLPDKVRQLRLIDQAHLSRYAAMIERLKSLDLLDSTQVLFCSGLSDGNSHSNRDLPVILAGGGYRHGQAIDVGGRQPLGNLFVSILQRFGVEIERFATGTSTLTGLV